MKVESKLDEKLMDAIATLMDDDLREELHSRLAGEITNEDFIVTYCGFDPDFEKILKSEFGIKVTADHDACLVDFKMPDGRTLRVMAGESFYI